jgi:hypothetical protein
MFSGRFGNTTGRPYLEALVFLPRLNLTGGVSFLVDTGADQTVLMPTDSMRMGINYGSLLPAHVLSGIGGTCKSFKESALIMFSDESNAQLVVYAIEILIAKRKAAHLRCASLLGRNVLHRLRMTYDFRQKKIVFTASSADARVSVKKANTKALKGKIKQLKHLPQ